MLNPLTTARALSEAIHRPLLWPTDVAASPFDQARRRPLASAVEHNDQQCLSTQLALTFQLKMPNLAQLVWHGTSRQAESG